MREILFRGKRKDNGEWIEGFYAESGIGFILADNGPTEGYFTMHEADSATICQYTGLADKNGRKIFEGDIIRDEDIAGVILFGRRDGSFHVEFYVKWVSEIGMDYRQELGYWAPECEVAGNIFDNPELINGGGR